MPRSGSSPADRLVKIPDGDRLPDRRGDDAEGPDRAVPAAPDISRRSKGTRSSSTPRPAASGSIACQWANHLGATVIGTVGSEEKAKLARAHGCHHVINYRTENFVERVAEITGGKKCDVVYDSVGRDTFPGSLDCLKPLGMWVLFGQSSGVIQNFDMNILAQKGSLFATRPTLFVYAAKREALEKMAAELMEVVEKGIVKIEVKQDFR